MSIDKNIGRDGETGSQTKVGEKRNLERRRERQELEDIRWMLEQQGSRRFLARIVRFANDIALSGASPDARSFAGDILGMVMAANPEAAGDLVKAAAIDRHTELQRALRAEEE